MRKASSIGLASFVLAFGHLLGAQSGSGGPAVPVIPLALLERPVTLRSGIGRAADEGVTASTEARTYHDQGLAYLHDYVWIEAARSFNQALRVDAKVALAYVGLSVAYEQMNQPAAAQVALQHAIALAPGLGDHDRQHIAVQERRAAARDDPRDVSKLRVYRQALDAALSRFPRDTELWLERGLAEAASPADRGQSSGASAIPFYEHALALDANGFAAHHYLTHAFENTGNIGEAVVHGTAFARLAPAVPHALHMYGHELRRSGRIREAIAQFEAADRLEAEYLGTEHVDPEHDWHYEHNLDLLGASYRYAGEMRRAEPLLKRAFELPTANLVQAVTKREWPMFLRSVGRVDEALAAADTLARHPNVIVRATGLVEAGYGRLAQGRFADALSAANAAVLAMNSAPQGAGLVAQALAGLQGELALRTGQREKGREALRSVVRRARAMHGPDEWADALFTIESIANAAREVGDWELATEMAQEMFAHDPSYAGTHYALGLVADHLGDMRKAPAEFTLAVQGWAFADADLPALVDARKRLSTLR